MKCVVSVRRAGWCVSVVMATLLYGGRFGGTFAQQVNPEPFDEARLLREASALEAAGELAASERVLWSILSSAPGSLSALLSLERVLAIQGRTAHLIPAVDRLLEKDAASPIAHQMRVRAFSALDQPADIERAGAVWIAATPDIETPYREIARIWRQRSEPGRAVEVLEQGRKRIRRQDALALELGDVYAEAGDAARAVREWNRAIGPGGHGFLLVQRRVMSLPKGGAALIPLLVQELTREPTTLPRQRAAAQIAIDAGLARDAERIARSVAGSLKQQERQSFLVEVARRADGAGLNQLAYWAYGELVSAGGTVVQLLAVRSRVAELALVVGDTAKAAEVYRELESAYAVGSPQRRQAVAVRIQLVAREGDVDRAAEEFAAFRREFSDAPELDAVASAVANALLDKGREDEAQEALTGVSGPRTGLARGRIFIRRGEIARARNELLGSAPALHGVEATEAIALASLLGRLSQPGGELVGKAMAKVGAGDREDGVELLFDGSRALAAGERAAILDFAAALADRAALPEQAEHARREIVSEYPSSREAPGALLALARAVKSRDGGLEEARLMLETLIVEHPRSALVPQARRELDRLLGRIPPGGVS